MRAIGRFQLLTRWASGHLGELFWAREAEGGGPWAVQIVRPELARDLRVSRLLLTEASAADRLVHPAAAPVVDAGREGDDVYVAAPLVTGQPLSALLKRARLERDPLPQAWVCSIGAQVAEGLAAAHALPWFPGAPAPLVHGSLSPRSIFVTWDGLVRVTGFGVGRARWSVDPSPARLAYVAPERFADRDPTPRTDAWSLGVLLYDALTNRRVFHRASEAETRQAVREANAPPLHAGKLDVGLEVADALQAMMAPRVEARPGDLGEIAQTLRTAAGIEATEARDGLARVLAERFASERALEARRLSALERRPGETPRRPSSSPRVRAAASSAPHEPRPAAVEAPGRLLSATWTADLDPAPEAPPRGDAEALEDTMKDAASPGRLGRYILEARVPSSGPRAIFRARDPNLGRAVMVHILDPGAIADGRLDVDAWIRLFKREARIAAGLHHPRLPTLLDAGRLDGRYFAVYRFVPGGSLAERLEHAGPLGPADLGRLGAGWAEALAALHAGGLVHGDVRAANLMVGDSSGGGAAVVDLSMAHRAGAPGHPLARWNGLAQAPETLDGAAYDARAEQFAFGAVLYQGLVGTRPFRGLVDEELEAAIRRAELRAPSDMGVSCPVDLEGVLARLLARDPADRYPSLLEAAGALRRVAEADAASSPATLAARGEEADPAPRGAAPPGAPSPSSSPPGDARSAPPDAASAEDGLSPRGAGADRSLEPQVPGVASTDAPHRVPRLPGDGDAAPAAADGEGAASPGAASPRGVLWGDAPAPGDVDAAWGCLARLASRVRSLDPEPEPVWLRTASAVAQRVARGGLDAQLAPLVTSLGRLARAERLEPGLVPEPAREALGALLRLERGATDGPLPRAAAIAWIALRYQALARPPEGEGSSSPRTAVLELRREAEARGVDREVVLALAEHLRERLSALDLSERKDERLLLAGAARDLRGWLEHAGYEVVAVDDGHAAWSALSAGGFLGAVVDAALPGQDGPALLRLGRGHPDVRGVRFAILGEDLDPSELGPDAAVLSTPTKEALLAVVRSWRAT
jgi:serine/threonine-protein kinase